MRYNFSYIKKKLEFSIMLSNNSYTDIFKKTLSEKIFIFENYALIY